MEKLGFALLSLMFVALLTGGLEAKPFDEIEGEIDAPFTYRSSEMTTVLDGTDQEYDVLLSPGISISMKWNLADKVSAFLQLENTRLDDGALGTAANTEAAGTDTSNLIVEQAYIKVEGFISEKLNFTLGTQDLTFTLRKGEGAFFMDIAESEVFIEPNLGLIGDVAEAGDAPFLGDARTKGTSEFGGFVFNYGSLADDNYAATLFWGVARETGADANVIPALRDADDKLFGVNVDYKLSGDDRNLVKVLLTTVDNVEFGTNIMTIGVGADYFGAVENLELYAEFYTQSGDAMTKTDAKGNAFRLGGKYDIQHDLKPYVELSIWSLSGDKGKAGETAEFISYENVDSTLILEDHLFGLDLDSNYTATKIEAGIETSLDINGDGTAEPVSVKFLFGQFTVAEVPSGVKDGLGTEIDITATLHYTENLSFTFALGMLSGADFFDQFKVVNPAFKGTDSMTFVSFGANVKF